MILDNVASVSRLQRDPVNGDKESYVLNEALATVAIELQPATSEQIAIADGVFGQTYSCFTTESGIRTGDLITVSGTGQTYKVRGVEDWSLPDLSPHYELVVVRMEEDEI